MTLAQYYGSWFKNMCERDGRKRSKLLWFHNFLCQREVQSSVRGGKDSVFYIVTFMLNQSFRDDMSEREWEEDQAWRWRERGPHSHATICKTAVSLFFFPLFLFVLSPSSLLFHFLLLYLSRFKLSIIQP